MRTHIITLPATSHNSPDRGTKSSNLHPYVPNGSSRENLDRHLPTSVPGRFPPHSSHTPGQFFPISAATLGKTNLTRNFRASLQSKTRGRTSPNCTRGNQQIQEKVLLLLTRICPRATHCYLSPSKTRPKDFPHPTCSCWELRAC